MNVPLDRTVSYYRPFLLALMIIHALLVCVMLWLAFDLSLPTNTFEHSPSLAWFAQHWPKSEKGWAFLFLIAGLVGMPGFLTLDGRVFKIPVQNIRLTSTVLLGMAHSFVAYAMYLGNPVAPVFGLFVLLAISAFFRIGAELLV